MLKELGSGLKKLLSESFGAVATFILAVIDATIVAYISGKLRKLLKALAVVATAVLLIGEGFAFFSIGVIQQLSQVMPEHLAYQTVGFILVLVGITLLARKV